MAETLVQFLAQNQVQDLVKEGIRISFIGERERFDYDLQEQMNVLEAKTDLSKLIRLIEKRKNAKNSELKRFLKEVERVVNRWD